MGEEGAHWTESLRPGTPAEVELFFPSDFRQGRRKRGRETSMCGCLSGGPAHNPGMCPDWESNQRPLVLRPALNPLSQPE